MLALNKSFLYLLAAKFAFSAQLKVKVHEGTGTCGHVTDLWRSSCQSWINDCNDDFWRGWMMDYCPQTCCESDLLLAEQAAEEAEQYESGTESYDSYMSEANYYSEEAYSYEYNSESYDPVEAFDSAVEYGSDYNDENLNEAYDVLVEDIGSSASGDLLIESFDYLLEDEYNSGSNFNGEELVEEFDNLIENEIVYGSGSYYGEELANTFEDLTEDLNELDHGNEHEHEVDGEALAETFEDFVTYETSYGSEHSEHVHEVVEVLVDSYPVACLSWYWDCAQGSIDRPWMLENCAATCQNYDNEHQQENMSESTTATTTTTYYDMYNSYNDVYSSDIMHFGSDTLENDSANEISQEYFGSNFGSAGSDIMYFGSGSTTATTTTTAYDMYGSDNYMYYGSDMYSSTTTTTTGYDMYGSDNYMYYGSGYGDMYSSTTTTTTGYDMYGSDMNYYYSSGSTTATTTTTVYDMYSSNMNYYDSYSSEMYYNDMYSSGSTTTTTTTTGYDMYGSDDYMYYGSGYGEEHEEAPEEDVTGNPIFEDLDENCSNWADQGQCESNPSYMKSNCIPSCRVREDQKVEIIYNYPCTSWVDYCGPHATITGWESWMTENCELNCNYHNALNEEFHHEDESLMEEEQHVHEEEAEVNEEEEHVNHEKHDLIAALKSNVEETVNNHL